MKRIFFRVRFSGEYFAPFVINGKDLPVSNSVKILGEPSAGNLKEKERQEHSRFISLFKASPRRGGEGVDLHDLPSFTARR